MVFWFVIRTLKYNVFYEPVLRRYSWYGYYVPLLSIPSLSVIAALKMRESENQKRRQWTGIFLVITVGVILLVMTNDLHQLVFRFPAEKPWTDDEYFYGPGFVLCVAWIAIGFLIMLGILIAKCRNPGKKKIWLPFVPLGLFFIWCIANIFRIPHLKIIAGDMAAACCLLIAALFESCIQCGLILVNNRYGELFQASRGINAQISDRNLNIRYTTGDGIELDKEEMKEALENPGYEKEGIRLNSIPINGGILIAKCRNPGKKKIWLPFVPLGLFFIWCIANIFRIPHLKIIAGDMAAACCLLIAALFESCIQCGLILVNNRYGELFQASRGINAQISDRNLNIRYTTGDGIELDKEEMKEALENPGYEKEGIRLNSIPINGGYAFWIEDIRQHRAAYESLYELREELRDRNQFLKLEYQKEKERKQAEEKNRLYDLMQKQTAEQFQQIAGYVDQLEQCTDHREYHRLLGKILIVGSYLKRRKNLTLSALEGKELKEEELIQSLRESCSNLVFCEIQGQYYIETGKETLPAQLVLRAYDFFEQIVELLLKQGGSFFYRLTELNGALRISVNLEGDCQTESLQEKYPLLHMEQEEEKEWFLALQLSEKGGNDEIL